MKAAPFLSVGMRDFLRGLLVAVLSAFIWSVWPIIETSGWPSHSDWIVAIKAGGGAFFGYIAKNFFTNTKGQILTKEPDKK